MAENSPTFQHVGCAGLEVHKSRQGRLNPCEIGQSSLRDLSCCGHWFPTLKTLGYYRMSLRDKGLDRFLGYSLGSNPNEALDKNVRAPFARLRTVADRNVRAPFAQLRTVVDKNVLCEAIAVGNDGKSGGSAIPAGLCPPAQQPSPRGYSGLASVRFSTPTGLCPHSAIGP